MKLKNFVSILKETYIEWTEDKGPRLGAALAYYAIFSIPPIMIIALAVLGLVYGDNVSSRLQTELSRLVGDQTSMAILAAIQTTGDGGNAATSLIGLAVLFFGASGVFAELQDALNTIWGVRPKKAGLKGLLKGRFTSFTMVLGICFLLLISLIVSAVVGIMSERLSSLVAGEAFGQVMDLAASLLVVTLLFATIFKFLPDVEIRWSDVWVGAFVTALFFTAGKFVIGTYIGKAGIGSAYGAAGSIIILITWVYYSAQILFFGAEFTQVYARHRGSRIIPKPNAELVMPEN